jgi:hypothetical protein
MRLATRLIPRSTRACRSRGTWSDTTTPLPVRFELQTGDAQWCALSSSAEPSSERNADDDASGGCARPKSLVTCGDGAPDHSTVIVPVIDTGCGVQ